MAHQSAAPAGGESGELGNLPFAAPTGGGDRGRFWRTSQPPDGLTFCLRASQAAKRSLGWELRALDGFVGVGVDSSKGIRLHHANAETALVVRRLRERWGIKFLGFRVSGRYGRLVGDAAQVTHDGSVACRDPGI